MTEKQWVEGIKKFLLSINLFDNIKIDTLVKLPYAKEILAYNLDFSSKQRF